MSDAKQGNGKTVVLTFDDCCKCHVESGVPVLKKYGFGATFFFCRFDDEWQKKYSNTLMTQADAKKLCDMGFEVGNHSWNHPDMRNLSDAEIASEFDRMERWLREAGCPPSKSFAYPGGPYAANVVPLLKKRGIAVARSTEDRLWSRDCDPMNVPSYPIVDGLETLFFDLLDQVGTGSSAVLVYHGIPETVHPRCSTAFATFESQMKFLHDNGYEVISMREQAARYGY